MNYNYIMRYIKCYTLNLSTKWPTRVYMESVPSPGNNEIIEAPPSPPEGCRVCLPHFTTSGVACNYDYQQGNGCSQVNLPYFKSRLPPLSTSLSLSLSDTHPHKHS